MMTLVEIKIAIVGFGENSMTGAGAQSALEPVRSRRYTGREFASLSRSENR